MTDELLTPAEHDTIAMTAELWNQLCAITSDGPAREGDLRELIFHIHGIQRAVLKQAAARRYPDLYRLLGGEPVVPTTRPTSLLQPPAPHIPVLRYDPTPADFDAENELWARWREQLCSEEGVPLVDSDGNVIGRVHGGPLQTPDSDDLAIPITIPTQEDPA